jgi:hypothetical protein
MKMFIFLGTLFITVITGCAGKKTPPADLFNQQASLPAGLSFHPLEWKVISSSFSKSSKTMSTLYGNDLAVTYARSGKGTTYPAGAELALVTWNQQEDQHWFGANIPATVRSVEHVSFPATGSAGPLYEMYNGASLEKAGSADTLMAQQRMAYIVAQKASVMP